MKDPVARINDVLAGRYRGRGLRGLYAEVAISQDDLDLLKERVPYHFDFATHRTVSKGGRDYTDCFQTDFGAVKLVVE